MEVRKMERKIVSCGACADRTYKGFGSKSWRLYRRKDGLYEADCVFCGKIVFVFESKLDGIWDLQSSKETANEEGIK
jgi:hypothetical protein